MDFEKSLTRLEKIVNDLESGELMLDQSLKLYEEGMNLGKKCQDTLSKAERKVYILKTGIDPLAENQPIPNKKKSEKEIKKKLNDNFDLFDHQ